MKKKDKKEEAVCGGNGESVGIVSIKYNTRAARALDVEKGVEGLSHRIDRL